MIGLLAARSRMNHASSNVLATLNPSDKASLVVLDATNLIASSASGGLGFARATKPLTGKMYFEAVFTTVYSTGGVIAAGVVHSTTSTSADAGGSTADWGYWGSEDRGGMYYNGVQKYATSGEPNGTVLGFAVDIGAGKLWVRRNGVWKSGDPAAGTSPSYTGLSGTLYPFAEPWGAGCVVTMRFASATFRDAAPSGYGEVRG